MNLPSTIFNWLVLTGAGHLFLSWLLLVAVRHDERVRGELFGSIKTLILGPKAVRLKHLFARSVPVVLAESSSYIRNLFLVVRWSGWVSLLLLLACIASIAARVYSQ